MYQPLWIDDPDIPNPFSNALETVCDLPGDLGVIAVATQSVGAMGDYAPEICEEYVRYPSAKQRHSRRAHTRPSRDPTGFDDRWPVWVTFTPYLYALTEAHRTNGSELEPPISPGARVQAALPRSSSGTQKRPRGLVDAFECHVSKEAILRREARTQ